MHLTEDEKSIVYKLIDEHGSISGMEKHHIHELKESVEFGWTIEDPSILFDVWDAIGMNDLDLFLSKNLRIYHEFLGDVWSAYLKADNAASK